MKTFRSNLQALHTLRERQEQEALHEYGKALRKQEEARNQLDSVQEELLANWLTLHHQLEAGAPAAELSQLQAYCEAVERRRKQAEFAHNAARQNARYNFTRLLVARQARTVVEKLIAAQKSRYLHERRRDEQKELDELASRRNTLFTLLNLTREPLWN